MIGMFQDFVRGCFVAPELEQKSIKMVDEATAAAKETREAATEAKKFLKKGNSTILFLGVGIGIGLTALAVVNKDKLAEQFEQLAGKN